MDGCQHWLGRASLPLTHTCSRSDLKTIKIIDQSVVFERSHATLLIIATVQAQQRSISLQESDWMVPRISFLRSIFLLSFP